MTTGELKCHLADALRIRSIERSLAAAYRLYESVGLDFAAVD